HNGSTLQAPIGSITVTTCSSPQDLARRGGGMTGQGGGRGAPPGQGRPSFKANPPNPPRPGGVSRGGLHGASPMWLPRRGTFTATAASTKTAIDAGSHRREWRGSSVVTPCVPLSFV